MLIETKYGLGERVWTFMTTVTSCIPGVPNLIECEVVTLKTVSDIDNPSLNSVSYGLKYRGATSPLWREDSQMFKTWEEALNALPGLVKVLSWPDETKGGDYED